MKDSPSEIRRIIERLRGRDQRALDELFIFYDDRLRRMVELRLDPRLRARIDAADVLREARLDASARLDDYLSEPTRPPFLWLREVVCDRLAATCQLHAGPRGRQAGGELAFPHGGAPLAMSAALASMLLGRPASSSAATVRADRLARLEDAINALDPIDREVLALRHFERLTRAETAAVLGVTEEVGAGRYIHALSQLKEILASMPGDPEVH